MADTRIDAKVNVDVVSDPDEIRKLFDPTVRPVTTEMDFHTDSNTNSPTHIDHVDDYDYGDYHTDTSNGPPPPPR